MCKCEYYWRVQAFEIGEAAVIDESINCGLSLVNTVQRKLTDYPEGYFSSGLSYCDDRPISLTQ